MPFDGHLADADVAMLRAARDGLVKRGGWRQSKLGWAGEPSHCAIGWLLEAADWNRKEVGRLVADYLLRALSERAQCDVDGLWAIVRFNDAPNRKKAEVVRLFDDAIRIASGVLV